MQAIIVLFTSENGRNIPDSVITTLRQRGLNVQPAKSRRFMIVSGKTRVIKTFYRGKKDDLRMHTGPQNTHPSRRQRSRISYRHW